MIPSPILRFSSTPVPYPRAMEIMERDVSAVIHTPHLFFLWFLEHPSLYTQGQSDRDTPLGLPFPVFKAPRGGKTTYHGPGQCIIYITASLHFFNNDIKKYVWFLEEWMIQCLRLLGVVSTRDPVGIGAWIELKQNKNKIAAIGVKAYKGVVSHGIALNVDPDLSHFQPIVPCGIKGKGVTSLDALGIHPDPATLQTALENSFGIAYAMLQ